VPLPAGGQSAAAIERKSLIDEVCQEHCMRLWGMAVEITSMPPLS